MWKASISNATNIFTVVTLENSGYNAAKLLLITRHEKKKQEFGERVWTSLKVWVDERPSVFLKMQSVPPCCVWRLYNTQKYSVYFSGLLAIPRLLCVRACSKVAAGCAGHYKWLAFRAR